ncbi:release factor [Daedalea quercina L-15889]|uniref:Release factor n=1 Tax=Daedalea quercina L-15889 TaxID=1314783 RepID=A0A165LSM3_9APHY|nr:release factor [Daedalea quercina L-15889]
MRALAVEEHASLTARLLTLFDETLPTLVVPPSSTAHLSALVELKSGVGGQEASLFVADLLRAYECAAHKYGWKATVMSSDTLDQGGFRDAILEVKGERVYDLMRWESGVHRVQRIPLTESSGRIHTSTVTVIVLPLSEDQSQPEKDDLFSMDEVKLEVMRSRGAGGQHVNKTESAVRLTHIPSGITVSMQDERSQHQNRRRAFQILRARLMDRKMTQDVVERRDARRKLVSSADRGEKIRTYNYPQDRVTDHRIGMSIMNLPAVMEGGGLCDFFEALEHSHYHDCLEEVLNS